QLKTPAFTLVNLPTVLTSAIFASLVPAISESLALERMDRIRAQSAAAIRITLLFTIPALVGLYLLASEIQALLFNDPSAGVVTRALSAAIIFLPLQMSSSAILQGMGKMMAPVTNLVIGGLIKLGITWLLAANPAFGINGAAYGSVAGFIVAAALNLTMAQSLIGAVFNWIEMVVKPIIAAAFMGLGVRALYNWSYLLVPSNSLATLIGVGAGAAIYGLVLLLIGGIRAGDLELVPRVGPRLAVILKKLR
ncbi:MAG: polysaccharide biosynthesis C-terminal domain-containing protein, partial [Actinobacteria bacterium]|nr:polysaccharide biosynthesis C-terminal domain-containing protein [Actinomycetota bacterium]